MSEILIEKLLFVLKMALANKWLNETEVVAVIKRHHSEHRDSSTHLSV